MGYTLYATLKSSILNLNLTKIHHKRYHGIMEQTKTFPALNVNINLTPNEVKLLLSKDDGSYNFTGDKVEFEAGYIVSIPWHLTVVEACAMTKNGGTFVLGKWTDDQDNVYCDLSVHYPYLNLDLMTQCKAHGEKAFFDCYFDKEVSFEWDIAESLSFD